MSPTAPPRLSLAALPRLGPAAPAFDVRAAGIGVVHLGPGAFFRAHQAPVYERLLASGDRRWGVCGASLRSADMAEALAPQDGLYALVRLGAGARPQVIGALREVLVAPGAPGAVRARLAAPDTRVVALTVTEKGYHLDADGALSLDDPAVAADIAGRDMPRTIYGWLVPALRARLEADDPPPLLLSCDNVPDNGGKLKRALARYAQAVGDDRLCEAIDRDLIAPASMVDSITPATDDALRERVRRELGVEDAWPVQREPFAQWVIARAAHPALDELEGAGVTLSDDVAGYERAKLRLLNGAHSTLAYLGLLAGCETVAEAMAEPRLAAFVETLMRRDLAPTLRPPAGLDLDAYVDAILDRFRNRAIRHSLLQIAADGSQKLPVRLAAPALEALAAGAPLGRLATPFAAWWRWLAARTAQGLPVDDPQARRLGDLAVLGDGDLASGLAALGMLPPRLAAADAFRAALKSALHRLDGGDPLGGLTDA